jgi:DNA-binding transcriptional ArsR family regulator
VSSRARVADPFGAVAAPTRRSILELLRGRTLTAGEIATHFPEVSRPAISKHLKILRQAQLVHATEQGREWQYHLDARPLGQIYVAWLSSFAPYWEESLERLKQQVEKSQSPTT